MYPVPLGVQGGEVQTHPEHQGLLTCKIRYSHLCHSGRGRAVGPSPGGRHLHLPADVSADDSLRYSSDALVCIFVACANATLTLGSTQFSQIVLKEKTVDWKRASTYAINNKENCAFVSPCVLYHTGLRIISNLDEVAFIQNLVFYIEAAYKVAVSKMNPSILITNALMETRTH